MNKLPLKAKCYILFHLIVTLFIFYFVIRGSYTISFPFVVPFIVFGCLFEILRLNAFSVNTEKFNISAGAAIIIAAIVLFNPLELLVFTLFYGLTFVLFPKVSEFTKAMFNIYETINVTFLSYIVWINLFENSKPLLDISNILPLLAAMFVFVIVDLIAVATIVAFASETSLMKMWKSSFNWIVASYILIAFIGIVLASVYKDMYIYGLAGFAIPLLLMRYNMYLFNKEKELQVSQLQQFNDMLQENNDQLIMILSHIIDARDNSLYGHSATVAKYAAVIGEKLGLTQEQIHDLRRGALLHDIGKIGISEAILQKPGKLTDAEFEVVKKHSLIGQDIIKNIKGMENISPIIVQHHEHFNGNGYPYKLKGDNIMIEARIVSLCDALDTMLSTRSYKKAWTIDEAVNEIMRCSGSQFDPDVVNAFIQVKNEKGTDFFINSAALQEDSHSLNVLQETAIS